MILSPPAPFAVTVMRTQGKGKRAREVAVREEREPISDFSPFSITSKMAAASFSLPAGPRGAGGGTCPASSLRASGGKAFICHECYALYGHYLRPEQYALREVRMRWLLRLLATQGAFAEAMVAALEETHDRPPGQTGFWNMRYFRVHDSGDFMASAKYVREWNAIARHFAGTRRKRDGSDRPPMRFWAPTRDWVFFPKIVRDGLTADRGDVPPTGSLGASAIPDLERAMRLVDAGGECPPNFAIRPSALHVGDRPPVVDGLAAGSTVLQPEQIVVEGDGLERCGHDASGDHCHCPAYERTESWSLSGNCEDAQCRSCWNHPERSVDYAEK